MRSVTKRCFDVIASISLLLLLSPLLFTLAIILAIAQGLPVLYREARIGRNRRPFVILKFRTMRPGANDAASVAPGNDPRVTPLGKMLRPSRLDELPQLVNILVGDMSFVGPRPLPPAHLATLPAEQANQLLAVAPGLATPTSLAFIAEDDVLAEADDAEATYIERILPAKVAAGIDYARSWSLATDVVVLVKTLLGAWSPDTWRASRDRLRALIR